MKMKNSDIKIGLIGLGNMGKNHLRILSNLKGVKLEFIYDPDESRAEAYSKEYNVPSVTDYKKACQKVDATIIVSPTPTHCDLVRELGPLSFGLFVEKPLAPSLEECIELDALCKSTNTYLQLGYVERFNPAVQVVAKILKSQTVLRQILLERINSRIVLKT
jgi:predicted dehydrogenase